MQEQIPIAAALGAADSDDLMRRVFEAGRAISFATDESCRRALGATKPAISTRNSARRLDQ